MQERAFFLFLFYGTSLCNEINTTLLLRRLNHKHRKTKRQLPVVKTEINGTFPLRQHPPPHPPSQWQVSMDGDQKHQLICMLISYSKIFLSARLVSIPLSFQSPTSPSWNPPRRLHIPSLSQANGTLLGCFVGGTWHLLLSHVL